MLYLILLFLLFSIFEVANEVLLIKCQEINAQHTAQNNNQIHQNLMDQTIHILTLVLFLNVIHSGLFYLQVFERSVIDIMSLTNYSKYHFNECEAYKVSEVELTYKTHVTNAELQEGNGSYYMSDTSPNSNIT